MCVCVSLRVPPVFLFYFDSDVVSNTNLARVAGERRLQELLGAGAGAEAPCKACADLVEALIGAVFLDCGGCLEETLAVVRALGIV